MVQMPSVNEVPNLLAFRMRGIGCRAPRSGATQAGRLFCSAALKGKAIMASSVSTQRIFYRDDWRCRYCKTDLLATFDTFASAVCDHVMPRALGGPDHPANRVAACPTCDRLKSGRPADTIADARAIVFRQRTLAFPRYIAIHSAMRNGGAI